MSNIIRFPYYKKSRPRRAETLPGFRIAATVEKVTSLTRRKVSEAFGLSWTASLVIEFQDPISFGKRDINVRRLLYNDRVWEMKWMDRTVTPGYKRYGLEPA